MLKPIGQDVITRYVKEVSAVKAGTWVVPRNNPSLACYDAGDFLVCAPWARAHKKVIIMEGRKNNEGQIRTD